MDPGAKTTAAAIAELLRRVEYLEDRVGTLERVRGMPENETVPAEPGATPPSDMLSPAAEQVRTTEWIPSAGRTLLVLGGAFVLRAVTEARWLSPAVGVALGIVYALVWLLLTDRAAARGDVGRATWHGLAASLIAYPLLWEATIKFGILEAAGSAAVAAGFTAAALAVISRRRLRLLHWVVTSSAVATLATLAVGTRQLAPFTACLLLLGLATLWIGYVRDIRGPAGLAAAAAFGSVILLTAMTVLADPARREELVDVEAVIVLQLALLVMYVGSSIARTLTRRRPLRSNEIVMGVGATAVGLGGAAVVANATGTGLAWLGWISGALGLAGYWAAFALVDREERRTNFVFYSSLALVFVLVAGGILLPGPWLAVALSLAAVVMAWLGKLRGRATLSLHGAVYVAAAATVSGLIARSIAALVTADVGRSSSGTVVQLVALLAAAIYCAVPAATHGHTWGRVARLPKLVVLVVAALGFAGAFTIVGARWLPEEAEGGGPQAKSLAVLRTGILSFGAVVLAWLGRYPLVREARWLVYPVLVLVGLKLALEDFRVGDPAALVVSFVLYGGALILAPRLARPGVASTESSPDENS